MPVLDQGNLGRRRQQVVHEGGRQRVPLIVVREVFIERATDALDDATGDLSSTTLGLIIGPQSSLTRYRSSCTAPVETSTSQVHAWVAFTQMKRFSAV